MIVEYALTNDGPIYAQCWSITPNPTIKPVPEMDRKYVMGATSHNLHFSINQLKFVCRELYKETAGREMMFNDVEFDSDGPIIYIFHQNPDMQYRAPNFVEFIEDCGQSPRLNWLSKVTVIPKSNNFRDCSEWVKDEKEDTILPLFQFCESHKTVQVKFHVQGSGFASLNNRVVSRNGLFLLVALRGKDVVDSFSELWLPTHNKVLLRNSLRAYHTENENIGESGKMVTNLTVFPDRNMSNAYFIEKMKTFVEIAKEKGLSDPNWNKAVESGEMIRGWLERGL
jgi:hypothetical protein